jgi:hypothetical protein
VGDKLHLRLNISGIPIEKKYREGTMKRTLKRELKGTEIAEREVEGFNCLVMFSVCSGYSFIHEHMVEFCGNTGCGCLA